MPRLAGSQEAELLIYKCQQLLNLFDAPIGALIFEDAPLRITDS
jgi:hypothetical protein